MTELWGVDFTSHPSRRKPITLARGAFTSVHTVALTGLETLPSFSGFEAWLAKPGNWVGGFDFPFGLPRDFVQAQGWPLDWMGSLAAYAAESRAALVDRFKAYCKARPAGQKFAHRATDRQAGSSPSMKWINPPVAWMLLEGVPRLLAAGVHLPGLHDGDPRRVAVEAYPGLIARAVLGHASYKSDEVAKQTPARQIRRAQLLDALTGDAPPLGIRLQVTSAQRSALIDDPQADLLDAVLGLIQAAWAAQQPAYGCPADVDALEGWIVAADRPLR